jgi:imidazolonepropionase-like amidohydrolase
MLALTNATLIDGTGAAPRKGMRVLIDGKKIAAIGRYVEIPQDAQVIDLKRRVLMPGLIDAHAHLGEHPYKDRAGIEGAKTTDSYAVMRKLSLEAGITTARSCGDYMYDTALLRDRINRGELPGPRLICSGKSFAKREGHPASTVWDNDPDTCENCGAYPKTPDEARSMVKEAVEAGMDFIKIIISDTNLSLWPRKTKQLETNVIEAIIDESHRHNKPVACHVDDLKQAYLALECGTDEIHHLSNISSGRFELKEYENLFFKMCERNVWLFPTLAPPRVFDSVRRDKNCPDGELDRALSMFRIAYEFNVPFGLGCDSGCPGVPWGKCIHEEMAEYVYNIGMTPLEVIRCVNFNNARILGMETQIGMVRAGAFADLLVLDEDPTEDIGNIESVYLVIRDGAIAVDNRRGKEI